MNGYMLQAALIAILFISALVQSWLGRSTRRSSQRVLRRLSVVISLVAFALSLLLLYVDYENDRLRKAIKEVLDTRAEFHRILDRVPFGANPMETLLPRIDAAIKELKAVSAPVEFLVIGRDDRSLGFERLAYGDKQLRSVYWVHGTNDESICHVRVRKGTDIRSEPPRLLGGRIFCTHVENEDHWADATRSYDKEYTFLLDSFGDKPEQWFENSRVGEMAAAARNTGYFYLCEKLLGKGANINKAGAMFRNVEDLTDEDAASIKSRHEDAAKKREFLRVLREKGGETEDCTPLCEDEKPDCPVAREDLVMEGPS